MLCYDFFDFLESDIPALTPDFLETDPHYASASAWIPHLVWSDLAGHLHSDCPGQCFIRNERIHLGCFHQPDSSSLSSLSSVASSTDVKMPKKSA